MGDVGDTEVAREDDDENGDVRPPWVNPAKENLNYGNDGIESVHGDVFPRVEGGIERSVGEECPVDDCDEECYARTN